MEGSAECRLFLAGAAFCLWEFDCRRVPCSWRVLVRLGPVIVVNSFTCRIDVLRRMVVFRCVVESVVLIKYRIPADFYLWVTGSQDW